ncbi:MAG: class II aldolase/adducin family protein [Woeseia sp.]
MIDEGYTKFFVIWTDREPLTVRETADLERWRKPLHDAGLVGYYEEHGIGFGNISVRAADPEQFIVSGTQTGHLATTGPQHYALVTSYDIAANRVSCRGAVQASSESLTHAAIYELASTVGAVVHIHDLCMWNDLKSKPASTYADIAYGTPEMADEFKRLFRETDFAETGVAAMAGHESGVVSIGRSLQEAANRVLKLRENHARNKRG